MKKLLLCATFFAAFFNNMAFCDIDVENDPRIKRLMAQNTLAYDKIKVLVAESPEDEMNELLDWPYLSTYGGDSQYAHYAIHEIMQVPTEKRRHIMGLDELNHWYRDEDCYQCRMFEVLAPLECEEMDRIVAIPDLFLYNERVDNRCDILQCVIAFCRENSFEDCVEMVRVANLMAPHLVDMHDVGCEDSCFVQKPFSVRKVKFMKAKNLADLYHMIRSNGLQDKYEYFCQK